MATMRRDFDHDLLRCNIAMRPLSRLRPHLLCKPHQHLAQRHRRGDPLREIEPQGLAAGHQIEPVGITAGAAPVAFGQIFQLVPPVMLITMLPVSIAGWGVREATMGLAFGYAGLLPNEGVNVSLLFGAVSFMVGAIGGLVWILSAEKAAQGAAPIEVPDNAL